MNASNKAINYSLLRPVSTINRQADRSNALAGERQALDAAIETERERITSPPLDREDAQERMRDDVAAFREAIKTRGAVWRIFNLWTSCPGGNAPPCR